MRRDGRLRGMQLQRPRTQDRNSVPVAKRNLHLLRSPALAVRSLQLQGTRMTAKDRELIAQKHVDDALSGRLPPEDVVSNIAEDMRRGEEAAVDHVIARMRELFPSNPYAAEWAEWIAKREEKP
jgi:hypothetical protein